MDEVTYHPNETPGKVWDGLARRDAMGAILYHTTPEEFERTGKHDANYLDYILAHFGGVEATVLDLGGGIGRIALYLLPRVKQYILHDSSAEMLERAVARLADKARLVLGNGVDLAGIGDGEVDFAFSYITFQHMDREVQVRYLQEVFRVLRPGGAFWFQVPPLRYPERFEDVARGDWPINIRRWAPGELLEVCVRIGFSVEAADCDGIQVLLRKPMEAVEWLNH